MRKLKTTMAAAALLLFGAAGCADLDVPNPNDPTRDQALQSAADVESLIAGSFGTWFGGNYWVHMMPISVMAFQSSSTAANWGMIEFTVLPRNALPNDPAHPDYGSLERPWARSYRALAAIADGLRTLNESEELADALEEETPGGLDRIRALGKTMQAVGHASIAVLYDQGFVVTENTQLTDESGQPIQQEVVSYQVMMDTATALFDEALALSEGASWPDIPAQWMSRAVSPDKLTELIYTWRAQFRASLPRTPEEADDDALWQAVLSDVENGIDETWDMHGAYTNGWWNGIYDYSAAPGSWGFMSYFLHGMADQSGNYQRWIELPNSQKSAWFGSSQGDDPFLIITPDQRFPQGSTIEEQVNNPGLDWAIPQDLEGDLDGTELDWDYPVEANFTRPARGTFRWSYYWYHAHVDYWNAMVDQHPLLEIEEMNLLAAEAHLHLGNEDEAADLINLTRVDRGGLNATDAAGTNTDCVPRLPNGDCGDLWEMLKWEKRMETHGTGLFGVSFYFDNRRWGDHYLGTPLQLPIPAGELQTLQMDVYTFGGDQPSSSDGSSYDFHAMQGG